MSRIGAATTLVGPLSATASEVQVASTSSFPESGRTRIDGEYLDYGSKTAPTSTDNRYFLRDVARGAENDPTDAVPQSPPAEHAAGATVTTATKVVVWQAGCVDETGAISGNWKVQLTDIGPAPAAGDLFTRSGALFRGSPLRTLRDQGNRQLAVRMRNDDLTSPLKAALAASATEIRIESLTVFAPAGRVLIEDEYIDYTSTQPATDTEPAKLSGLTRSSPKSHPVGALVESIKTVRAVGDPPAGVSATQSSVPVSDVTGFPSSGMVFIDDEYIRYSSKTTAGGPQLLNCERGVEGSTRAAHDPGARVRPAKGAERHPRPVDPRRGLGAWAVARARQRGYDVEGGRCRDVDPVSGARALAASRTNARS